MTHRRLLTPTVLLLLCSASIARAGTYQVLACDNAPGFANNSWAWSTTDTAQPAHYEKHENCPYTLGGAGGKSDQEGGLSTTDALALHNGAQPATSAAWTFTAPPNTTIAAISYERYIGHEIDPYNDWSPALRADGQIIPGETCLDTVQNNEYCIVGGPPGHGQPAAQTTGLTAHQLSLGILCQAPPETECVTGATLHSAWAAMYSTTVTLNDPTPPTLNTPTGPLWEPTGYHEGTQTLAVSALDTGGGIQSITLTIDGQPQATYTAPCDYTYPQPCPLSTATQTLQIPTATLPDGTHTLTLTATDAANNHSTPLTQQITTDNNPPPPPAHLTATPTQPGSPTYLATWTDPPTPIPFITATYQLCPTSDQNACSTPTQAPAAGPALITAPGPGPWTLTLTLTDAAGHQSAPATTTLAATLSDMTTSTTPTSTINAPAINSNPSHINSPHRESPIRLHITRHHHRLIIHITGPNTGRVQITYTIHNQTKTVRATKTRLLRHSQLSLTIPIASAGAQPITIHIQAQLGNQPPINKTLRLCVREMRGPLLVTRHLRLRPARMTVHQAARWPTGAAWV